MNSTNDYNPIAHFQKWFHEVDMAHPEDEVNTMLLSTIGLDGFPKNRIVLLKRFTWEGFVFFTNYNSDKGKAIAKNNKVSVVFNWSSSRREVLIIGKAEKLPKNLSEGYFESRPRGSKLSAWASQQSDVIPSREVLDDRLMYYELNFKNKTIPKPEHWGGYIIKPSQIRFIEHDRLVGFSRITQYDLQSDYSWSKEIKYCK